MIFSVDWTEAYCSTWAECPLLWRREWWRWLEVGMYEGRSAAHTMERMKRGGLFVGVDPFSLFAGQEWRCRENVALAAYVASVKAIVVRGTIDDVPIGDFDGAYLDGPKDYAGAKHAMDRLLQMVKPGGLIILDDVHWDDQRQEIRMDWISPVGQAVLDATRRSVEAFARCGHQWVYSV